MNYKIYYLTDHTNKIRYIGLTKLELKKRLQFHLNEYRFNTHKTNWVKKNRDNISIILIEDCIKDINSAKEAEVTYIKLFKENGVNLVNGTEGGDYPSLTRKEAHNKGKSKYNHLKDLIINEYINSNEGQSFYSKKYNIPKSEIGRILLGVKKF
jgi:predicted GIY-YIG superfamily endonuclease